MGSPLPLTPPDRDRALARLGRITAGTGIGALIAVGGFSYVAAASYSGKQVKASTVAAVATTAAAAPTVAPMAAPTVAPTAAPVVVTGGS